MVGGPLNKGFDDDVDNIYEGAHVSIIAETFGSDVKRTSSLKRHIFVQYKSFSTKFGR